MAESKIPFVVGKKRFEAKPDRDTIANVCQRPGHYVIKQSTIAEIYQYITQGRCWRAGVLKATASTLKKEAFEGSYLFALDFDTCDYTPEEMIEYAGIVAAKPNFWYYSFSQGKKEKNNFRLVWCFDKAITVAEYEALYKAVLQDDVFSNADKQTKDISRLWFGTSNGGGLISNEPQSLSIFDKYPRTAATAAGKKRGSIAAVKKEYAQGKTQADFVMESAAFDFPYYLKGVCDLWDKWAGGVYLHYAQRLLLFTELKCLKYAERLKKSPIERIMRYYNAELYAGSKCSREEIAYFMSDKTMADVGNKIVSFAGKDYTISEYFNSGAYLLKEQMDEEEGAEEEERTTVEELDETMASIAEILEKDGIHYVNCQTEAGKTEQIIRYLCRQDFTRQKIIYSVPTYALIKEFIERLVKNGFDRQFIHAPAKIEYTEEELLLLDAGFPNGIKTTPEMLERKRELQKIGDCREMGLFLITHACLTHLRDYNAHMVIIDEGIEDSIICKEYIPRSCLDILKGYIDEEGRAALDAFIMRLDNAGQLEEIPPQEIDFEAIYNHMDYKGLIAEPTFRDIDTKRLYPIGKLRNADKIMGTQDYKGIRYLYFEVKSRLIQVAMRRGIRVKLFNGTPKDKQLYAAVPEYEKIIDNITIKRAKPIGTIKQFIDFNGSKAYLTRQENWQKIIDVLERQGVDWRNTNTLVLKQCLPTAKKLGFHIPQTMDGEEIYIENCAGLDCLKGQNLIVIGKADKPKDTYIDMLGSAALTKSHTMSKKSGNKKHIEGIKGRHSLYAFEDDTLWGLQSQQMRQSIEQAVARARTLRNNVVVYVFADYPVRDAIFIK